MELWVSNNKYLMARSTYPLATQQEAILRAQEGELGYFQVLTEYSGLSGCWGCRL